MGALTLQQSADLTDAINSGLDTFYSLLPRRLKETTASVTLNAPKTVSVQANNGSNVLDNSVFTSEQYFSTIKIDGDDNFNEIVNDKELLDAYSGTTGSKSATIYGDTAYLTTAFTRLITNPQLSSGEMLIRDDELLGYENNSSSEGRVSGGYYSGNDNFSENRMNRRTVGRPDRYAIDHVGMGDIIAIIRVYPIPVMSYKMRFRIELAPPVIKQTQLKDATELHVPARYIGQFIPICADYLRMSSFFDKSKDAIVEKQYERAIQRLDLIEDHVALPDNDVSTEAGF